MRKFIRTIAIAILFFGVIQIGNAQSNLGPKKGATSPSNNPSAVRSTSEGTTSRQHSAQTNSQTVPAYDQIHSPIRWYALENEQNEQYWASVNTSRARVALELGRSIHELEIAGFLQAFGLTKIIRESRNKDKTNYWIFENTNTTPEQFVSMAKAATEIDGILFLEPSVIYTQSYTPNDPLWESQWGPYASYFDEAWEYGRGGNSLNVVAVIDDACDWNHEDLFDQVWYGYDYAMGDFDISPAQISENHGTHVTGTVAATIGNGIGVAGMVNDTVYFAKVGDDQGGLVDQAIVDALYDIATIDRITAVNMSLGADAPSTAMEQACDEAWNSGKLLLVASGNNGQGFIGFPAAYLSCVAIGSIGADGTNLYLTDYSQFGPEQELCASGGDEAAGFSIISTLPGNEYGVMDGTSMAAPHVTGLAGLIKNLNPDLNNAEIRNIMAATAFDMGDTGWDQFYGYGFINAIGAVEAALGVSTGTRDFSAESVLTLYPNPSANRIILDMKRILPSATIEICDITGKHVQWVPFNNEQKLSVDIEGLLTGVYLLKMQSTIGAVVTKFVKI